MEKLYKLNLITLFIFLLCSNSLTAQKCGYEKGNLLWSDEFDYTGLPDPNKWGYDEGGNGWGNNEAQYYTSNRTENARVENGQLVIEARKESYGGNNYTSARLVTRGKGDWLYGRIEVNAQIPVQQGTWPAIWMLPTDWEYGGWPQSGEIDIMENFTAWNIDRFGVDANVHTDAYNHLAGTNKGGGIHNLSDITSNFHTYAVDWYPDHMDFSVDGNYYFTFDNEGTWQTWPYDKRFHLILNIAIGGSGGGWIDDNLFNHQMLVDYVRVYELVDAQSIQQPFNGTAQILPGRLEAENYDVGCNGDAYSDFTIANQGGDYRNDGVDIETTSDIGGGYNVGWQRDDEWMEYTVDVLTSGDYLIDARVASAVGGDFHVEIDGNDVTGLINVANTGDWQNWITVTSNVFHMTSGQHLVRIFIDNQEFNLNYLDFDIITDLDEKNEVHDLMIYPNPVSSLFHLNGNINQWELFDILGTLVLEGNGNTGNLIDVNAGVYFLHAENKIIKIVKK